MSSETTRRETGALLGQHRQNLPDPDIDEHTHTNDEGDKIHKIEFTRPSGDKEVVETNLSTLFAPTPSTTSNIEILLVEAQLVDDGTDVGNPHIPATDDILASAVQQIETRGHTPAWEVTDDD